MTWISCLSFIFIENNSYPFIGTWISAIMVTDTFDQPSGTITNHSVRTVHNHQISSIEDSQIVKQSKYTISTTIIMSMICYTAYSSAFQLNRFYPSRARTLLFGHWHLCSCRSNLIAYMYNIHQIILFLLLHRKIR